MGLFIVCIPAADGGFGFLGGKLGGLLYDSAGFIASDSSFDGIEWYPSGIKGSPYTATGEGSCGDV